MTKGVCLIKLFGLPVIIGVILGNLLPGFAFRFAPVASAILFALLFVTLIDIDLKPKKVSASSLVEGLAIIIFCYILLPTIFLVVGSLLGLETRILTAILLTTMAPFALVAPLFCQNGGGKPVTSLWQVLISMVLCPILIPFMMWASGLEMPVFIKPLVLYLSVISAGPYLLGLICQLIFGDKLKSFSKYKSSVASILLAVLVYVLFGSAVSKWEVISHSKTLIWWLLVLHIISDFGVLYFVHFLLRRSLGETLSRTYAITMGMKNMAIPAGLLLAYDPSMAFIPALGFVVHAFFFNYLGMRGKFLN